MKAYRLLFAILLSTFIYTGCQKEEIAYYDQTPRLNFMYSITIPHNFSDADYLSGNEYHEVGVSVELQGNLLTEARDFVFKVSPDSSDVMIAGVTVEEKYTFSAIDTNAQQVFIKVKRPEKPGKRTDIYRNYLKFDTENPAHQWEIGRADKEICKVEVTYELLPNRQYEWDTWTWGDYSDAKYMFMLDHFKVVYGEMPWDGGGIKTVYENYKNEHGPILDENGEEIVFP